MPLLVLGPTDNESVRDRDLQHHGWRDAEVRLANEFSALSSRLAQPSLDRFIMRGDFADFSL